MKILITGAKGQLGSEVVKKLDSSAKVIATDKEDLDFTDKKQTANKIKKEKPELLLHIGAWTNVDGCAAEPDKALFINGEGTKNVALAAKEVGAKFIYISTNEVFDGKKSSPYLEDDKANPITPYGKSKYLGEKYTQELQDNWAIVRVSWLYGPASTVNFPHKILSKAREQGFLKVVDDEISTPTYTPDVAEALYQLIKKKNAKQNS